MNQANHNNLTAFSVFTKSNSGSSLSAARLTTLATFNGTNGAASEASLLADANGNFYGTTSKGGPTNNGTVFELSPVIVAGDYNSNGIVDTADYVVWRKGLGTKYTQNDYNVWRANFGQTAPGAGNGAGAIANAAVPEPATFVLLMFAAACWRLRRSRTA